MSNPEYDIGAGLDPIAARAFLRKISDDRLYALYLCAVSLLLALGVPPHVVREIAGHSDIEVTMMV